MSLTMRLGMNTRKAYRPPQYPAKSDAHGKARVRYRGRDFYFGNLNTPESWILFGRWRELTMLDPDGNAPEVADVKAEVESKWRVSGAAGDEARVLSELLAEAADEAREETAERLHDRLQSQLDQARSIHAAEKSAIEASHATELAAIGERIAEIETLRQSEQRKSRYRMIAAVVVTVVVLIPLARLIPKSASRPGKDADNTERRASVADKLDAVSERVAAKIRESMEARDFDAEAARLERMRQEYGKDAKESRTGGSDS